VFTDVDFADDVALLAEILEVLDLAMTIIQEEAVVFGFQKNWSKTKILQVPPSMPCSTVQVADGHVDVVDASVYLVAWSTPLVAAEVRSCVRLAYSSILHELAGKKRIWKSSIRLDTKIRLYQTYIVPVLLYGCKTWPTAMLQCSRIGASDMWALR